MTGPQTWLTVQQVADELQANPDIVRRWIREGKLPAAMLGGNRSGYRIDRADLDALLRRLKERGDGQ